MVKQVSINGRLLPDILKDIQVVFDTAIDKAVSQDLQYLWIKKSKLQDMCLLGLNPSSSDDCYQFVRAQDMHVQIDKDTVQIDISDYLYWITYND